MQLTESLVKKWSPLMDVGEAPAQNSEMKKALAQLLENKTFKLSINYLLLFLNF